ncbi:MAG: 23S rRNA (adenine(2503)-C(2))-methyltransferase RlmN [Catonella sp.]|nr:23S rRNA (adenine(2503)-C(2))-methyltransferase RlmN [Catonella sp.]MDY6355873.1 23S rRNA (adenine(2503)-C(2))-methyltransferase RlmN [Catonella sp.]
MYKFDDIASMNMEELTELVTSRGLPKFRAKQLFSWIHKELSDSFDEMTNLPKKMREDLAAEFPLRTLKRVDSRKSSDGSTEKFVFELSDGHVIESVLMKYHHGNSVCVSSQVGCRMGCRFCASTLTGLARNLLPSEILSQVYHIQKASGERVSNVVIMGTGEPLDNFDGLVRFVELLTDENGLNISERNITMSTCGLVPEIRKLADLKPQFTLAISLHAPDDEARKRIMPIANKYTISEVIGAADYYFEKTGRRVSYEYSLIAGENDTREQALKLVNLLKGKNCHVNLIPVNPIKERNYSHTGAEGVAAFKNILEKNGITATVRREMGADINAACGQLRKDYMDRKEEERERLFSQS